MNLAEFFEKHEYERGENEARDDQKGKLEMA